MIASRLLARVLSDSGMLEIVAFQSLVTGGKFSHVGAIIP